MMGTETIKRVTLYTGNVAHLIDSVQPRLPGTTEDRMASLCNLVPVWPGVWLNGDTAVDLPLCKTCESVWGSLGGLT